MVMALGLDIGYYAVKGCTGPNRFKVFPSVVGTADAVIFSLDGDDDIVLEEPVRVAAGEHVARQSLWRRRRQDRSWIQDEEWWALFLAGLSELCWCSGPAVLTVGLPVSWYLADKDGVRAKCLGTHRFKRASRETQAVTIEDARVLPQGIGGLMSVVFDDDGQVVTGQKLFEERVAVVDIGGYTVNLLDVEGLRVGEASRSVSDVGGWRAVRALSSSLEREWTWTGDDGELSEVLRSGWLQDGGRRIDARRLTDAIRDELAAAVAGEMTRLWGSCRQFYAIIVCGGGANLVGERIAERFGQVIVLPQPELANALGYWRFSRRVALARSVRA